MFTTTVDSTMINTNSWSNDSTETNKIQELSIVNAQNLLDLESLNSSATNQMPIKYTSTAILQVDADSTVIDNYNYNQNGTYQMNTVYETNSNTNYVNDSSSSIIDLDQQQQVYYDQQTTSNNKLSTNESIYSDQYQYDNLNQISNQSNQNNQIDQFDNNQIIDNQLYNNYTQQQNNQLIQQNSSSQTNYSTNNQTDSLLNLNNYQSDQTVSKTNTKNSSLNQTTRYQNRSNQSNSKTNSKHYSNSNSIKTNERKLLRPHSTPATLIWLEDNYEIADGVCIPRSTLYLHYVDFCSKNCIQPVNAASFGKIIRQQFPQLTTRRLGTRGQSRYHYYGIAIKDTSIYHQQAYSKKDPTNSSSTGNKESSDKLKNSNDYYNNKMHRDNLHNSISNQNSINNISLNYQHQKQQHFHSVNNQNVTLKKSLQSPDLNASSLNNQNNIQSNSQLAAINLSASNNLAINGSNTINLPEFPNVKELLRLRTRSQHYSNKHLISLYSTFLMMYRTHCQRILDILIRCNLSELNTFISYFWQAIPEHLKCVLAEPVFHCLIAICDCILYKCMTQILYAPLLHSNLPENLIKLLAKFSDQLEWNTKTAMLKQPEALRCVKLALSRKSACLLRRQSCLSKYICETRIALTNDHNARKMLISEFRKVDMSIIFSELLNKLNEYQIQIITTAISEFEILLEDLVLDNWLNWINNLLNKCISFPSHNFSFAVHAEQFIQIWNLFSLNILKQLNSMMSPFYKMFNLIRNLFNIYILYTLEYLHFDERIKEFTLSLYQDQCPKIVEPFFQDSIFDFTNDYNSTVNNIKTEQDIKLEFNDQSITNYFNSKTIMNSDCNYDTEMYSASSSFYNSDYYKQQNLPHDSTVFNSFNATNYNHCRQFSNTNGSTNNYQTSSNFNNHFHHQLNGYRSTNHLTQPANHHHLHHHLHQQTYHNYLIINNPAPPNDSSHYHHSIQDNTHLNNNIVLPFKQHNELINQTIDHNIHKCDQQSLNHDNQVNQENSNANCFQNSAY